MTKIFGFLFVLGAVIAQKVTTPDHQTIKYAVVAMLFLFGAYLFSTPSHITRLQTRF